MTEESPIKRGRGRPRKHPLPPKQESAPKGYKMRASPNWDTVDPSADDTPDRLRIPSGAIPDGLEAQWITDSIYGQSMPQHRAEFEKKGWTPVHQDDFDGHLDGLFMVKGQSGEINVDGLVLMVRPAEYSEKARLKERRRAMEQVAIKEAALTGGELPITLDARHPSAVKSNRISKSYERIEIPED